MENHENALVENHFYLFAMWIALVRQLALKGVLCASDVDDIIACLEHVAEPGSFPSLSDEELVQRFPKVQSPLARQILAGLQQILKRSLEH